MSKTYRNGLYVKSNRRRFKLKFLDREAYVEMTNALKQIQAAKLSKSLKNSYRRQIRTANKSLLNVQAYDAVICY